MLWHFLLEIINKIMRTTARIILRTGKIAVQPSDSPLFFLYSPALIPTAFLNAF